MCNGGLPRLSEGFAGTYSRQAHTYDLSRSAGQETLKPLIAALAHLPRGSVALDVGGGTGNYAVELAQRGLRVTVVDRSPDMLRVAAGKGLPVALVDATALPVPDGTVQAAMMISMLHQVPDWPQALREAQRILVPLLPTFAS